VALTTFRVIISTSEKGMDRDWTDWVEDEDETAPKRRRRDKRGNDVEVEVDVEEDELTEWRRERGSKGRKPVDEHRRPRRRDDDEEF